MKDIFDLIPKDKGDDSNINELAEGTNEYAMDVINIFNIK